MSSNTKFSCNKIVHQSKKRREKRETKRQKEWEAKKMAGNTETRKEIRLGFTCIPHHHHFLSELLLSFLWVRLTFSRVFSVSSPSNSREVTLCVSDKREQWVKQIVDPTPPSLLPLNLICIILRFLREGKSFYRTDSSLDPQLTKLVFCIQGIHRFKLFAQSGEDDQERKKDAEDASRGRLMTREILFEGKKRILGFFTGYKESKEHEDSLVLHFLSSSVWWWLWWRKEFLTGWGRVIKKVYPSCFHDTLCFLHTMFTTR